MRLGSDNQDASLVSNHIDVCAVKLTQHLGTHDLFGGSDSKPPVGQVEHTVNHRQHRVYVVRHKQNRRLVLLALLVEQFGDDLLLGRVECAQRLVGKN